MYDSRFMKRSVVLATAGSRAPAGGSSVRLERHPPGARFPPPHRRRRYGTHPRPDLRGASRTSSGALALNKDSMAGLPQARRQLPAARRVERGASRSSGSLLPRSNRDSAARAPGRRQCRDGTGTSARGRGLSPRYISIDDRAPQACSTNSHSPTIATGRGATAIESLRRRHCPRRRSLRRSALPPRDVPRGSEARRRSR